MHERHVGFVGVLEGVDVGGSYSVTDESVVGKGTVSPRSEVCSSSSSLCFRNAVVGGMFVLDEHRNCSIAIFC